MVMPRQMLEEAIQGRAPMIFSSDSNYPIVLDEQVQIASIDFRLGTRAVKMASAALPHGEPVAALIERLKHYDFELFTNKVNQLDRSSTYLIELMEECQLPEGYYFHFSPKSSTGRCDVFVRVLCDAHSHYDQTPSGYRGRLWLEVTPLSFNVMVKAGLTLAQGRIKTPSTRVLETEDVRRLHTATGIVFNKEGKALRPHELEISRGRFYFHIDLDREIVGFVAKQTALVERLDMTKVGAYEPRDFWEPIYKPKNGHLILHPNLFYLLATKERVRIPAEVCGEIMPYETSIGEIRPHYAGFFDNGFGGEKGTHGVLEVRGREMPLSVKDGQKICAMMFEKTFEVPSKLYDGNYTKPDPSFSKHFVKRYEAWSKPYWQHM